MTAYILCADGAPDLTCHDTETRDSHKADLMAMGCKVQIVAVPDSIADVAFDILSDSHKADTRVTSIRKAAKADLETLAFCLRVAS